MVYKKLFLQPQTGKTQFHLSEFKTRKKNIVKNMEIPDDKGKVVFY